MTVKGQHSGLIWITGYSGAGKTTIARITSENLKAKGVPTVLLDGDDLRSIFGERFGHALDDRRQLAHIYSRLCQKIAACGVTVVIATIVMFESARQENRASNERYLEVYLDVPLAVRAERDPKGLYRAATSRPTNTVGFSSDFEEPVSPDLVIKNYGEMLPAAAGSLVVAEYMELGLAKKGATEDVLHGTSLSRVQYWDSYYRKRKAPINPSSFAMFCNENYFDRHCHLLE